MLFKNIDEIKQFLAVGAGTDFNRLKPHIELSENNFLRPLLGSKTFELIQSFYESLPTEEPDHIAQLLTLCQKAIIHLTYYSGFQVLNATISDTGFKRSETEKTKSLFKYQEDELKEYFKTSGFNTLDQILEFLEENIQAFPDFKESENRTFLKSSFIPSTNVFHRIVDIANSRLTFLRLQPSMRLAEDLYIIPALGPALYEEIKADLSKDLPQEKTLNILPYIQRPLAFFASAFLMEETGANLTENGLYFDALQSSSLSNSVHAPVNDQRITLLATRNRQLGENYLLRLYSYLLANADQWPNAPTGSSSKAFHRDNTNKKTFWA